MMNLERLLCDAIRLNLETGGRPKVPVGGELLWRWFGDLTASRRRTVIGPDPISLAEIEAYCHLTKWPIEERHIRILAAMDETFRRHCSPSSNDQSAPSRPMTAVLFDAMFG